MVHEFIDLTEQIFVEKLFKLSFDRANEINDEMIKLEQEIVDNIDFYSHTGNEQSPGPGLDVGKLLERLLKLAKTPSEELGFIFTFRSFMDRVLDKVHNKMIEKKMKNIRN